TRRLAEVLRPARIALGIHETHERRAGYDIIAEARVHLELIPDISLEGRRRVKGEKISGMCRNAVRRRIDGVLVFGVAAHFDQMQMVARLERVRGGRPLCHIAAVDEVVGAGPGTGTREIGYRLIQLRLDVVVYLELWVEVRLRDVAGGLAIGNVTPHIGGSADHEGLPHLGDSLELQIA